jgi:hypothetical protein
MADATPETAKCGDYLFCERQTWALGTSAVIGTVSLATFLYCLTQDTYISRLRIRPVGIIIPPATRAEGRIAALEVISISAGLTSLVYGLIAGGNLERRCKKLYYDYPFNSRPIDKKYYENNSP